MLSLELNVLTLNVWAIPFVSSDREKRIEAIGSELSTGQYDIVSLQEVWSQTDCEKLKSKTEAVLPYSHYFFSGVVGAGLLVLSKFPIIGTFFHVWSVNGYFHRIQHADWFAGKGVGLCRIRIGDHIVHLYNAHLHAEYDKENDEYKTHRVIQAFDTAQFLEATRGDSVLQILAGDLNAQPQDISYKVLLSASKLRDTCHASNAIATHESHQNSYTSKRVLVKNPLGIRIDHILVRSADNADVAIVEYKLPLPDRIPGQKFSYSDHEAVLAKLKLTTRQRVNDDTLTCPATIDITIADAISNTAYGDSQEICSTIDNVEIPKLPAAISTRISLLHESIALCESALQKLKIDRMIYYSVALFLTFVLVALVEFTVPSGFKTLYLLLKFILFGVLLFSVFMGSIWNFMERNGILSGKLDMENMLRHAETFELGLNQ